jgi:hypothetical protein
MRLADETQVHPLLSLWFAHDGATILRVSFRQAKMFPCLCTASRKRALLWGSLPHPCINLIAKVNIQKRKSTIHRGVKGSPEGMR